MYFESSLSKSAEIAGFPPFRRLPPDWMALTMFTMCFLECKELDRWRWRTAIFLQNSCTTGFHGSNEDRSQAIPRYSYNGWHKKSAVLSAVWHQWHLCSSFNGGFSCGKKPPKHLRLLEPTKTAKALHRILTLKGVGTRIDSMMRFNPPQNWHSPWRQAFPKGKYAIFAVWKRSKKNRVESEVVEKVSHEKKTSYFPWVIRVV